MDSGPSVENTNAPSDASPTTKLVPTILHEVPGKELVTTTDIELGKQKWLVAAVTDVRLNSQMASTRIAITNENLRMSLLTLIVMGIGFTAKDWLLDPAISGCISAVGVIGGGVLLIITVYKYAPRYYNLIITLKNAKPVEPTYRWQDAGAAEAFVTAANAAVQLFNSGATQTRLDETNPLGATPQNPLA